MEMGKTNKKENKKTTKKTIKQQVPHNEAETSSTHQVWVIDRRVENRLVAYGRTSQIRQDYIHVITQYYYSIHHACVHRILLMIHYCAQLSMQ